MCNIDSKKTSHLPIVDACTLELMKKKGEVLIQSNLGKQKLKTIADIFADVLSVRDGHLVIPWKTKDKPIGFRFIFFVEGNPYFIQGEEFPIRIPLKKEFKEFSLPVEEEEALDLWRKKLLWNAIGKKSLGRGRSLTHQTPWETEILVNLLVEKNETCSDKEVPQKGNESNGVSISIQNQLCIEDGINKNEDLPDNLSEIPIQRIRWDDGKGKFIVEKALEAWIMENIDRETGESFRSNVLGLTDVGLIISFHNYLPFGVQGSNMDLVIFTRNERKLVAHILELKKDKISFKDFLKYKKAEIDRYAEFIEKFLKAYDIGDFSIRKGIISFQPNKESIENYKEYLEKQENEEDVTKWFYYKIDCSQRRGSVKFFEVLF